MSKKAGVGVAAALLLWVSGAWGAEVFIPPVEGAPGNTVLVPVTVDEVENLAGIKVVLQYDQKVLRYLRGGKTPVTDSLMHIVNDRNPGTLIFVMAGARGVRVHDGAVFNLWFAIADDAGKTQTTEITITHAEMMSDELKAIPCTVKGASVKIGSPASSKAEGTGDKGPKGQAAAVPGPPDNGTGASREETQQGKARKR